MQNYKELDILYIWPEKFENSSWYMPLNFKFFG